MAMNIRSVLYAFAVDELHLTAQPGNAPMRIECIKIIILLNIDKMIIKQNIFLSTQKEREEEVIKKKQTKK